MRFKRVDQVVERRLCMGCGACAAACAQKAISLPDVADEGIRPRVDEARCEGCGECVKMCPGVELRHGPFNGQTIVELRRAWGPVLEVWEGYAAEPEIRFRGSSGGVATALAFFAIEEEKMSGVLQVWSKPESPWLNEPVFSRRKSEVLASTGSRYSPAAPCSALDHIRNANGACVFIGKPCDVAALRKFEAAEPKLREKVYLAISIFCAGTPSTRGTEKLLESLGVKAEQVRELRYRGHGWPGKTTVKIKGSDEEVLELSYEQAWGQILSRFGQVRCRLCPDSTGEFADISCGDPWYREPKAGEAGSSLVLTRTVRGRNIFHKAIEAGYVKAEKVEASTLPRSQEALLRRRRSLWGRLAVMRSLGIAVPAYKGFALWENWRELEANQKLRSVGGMFKRIITRGWLHRQKNRRDLMGREAAECRTLH